MIPFRNSPHFILREDIMRHNIYMEDIGVNVVWFVEQTTRLLSRSRVDFSMPDCCLLFNRVYNIFYQWFYGILSFHTSAESHKKKSKNSNYCYCKECINITVPFF